MPKPKNKLNMDDLKQLNRQFSEVESEVIEEFCKGRSFRFYKLEGGHTKEEYKINLDNGMELIVKVWHDGGDDYRWIKTEVNGMAFKCDTPNELKSQLNTLVKITLNTK